ncbi:hypothetical protein KSD_41260 [Ktedonobacter sp. SOSP1-85]|uniref:hypothetical protein n=1 Tax=Ktedonobacter sp. SOSP1-85 TaxID=2778367 RepID=UPI00191545E2|nr:hypothetical protein [Ktedonobacter sp. SOSP1-85]GHO76355.1 hypothetical protein KSD_41260 [Ktedonobacter sp. SOSP1-85]
MDPISTVEAALTAGAVASAQPLAGQALKDVYQGLKALIVRRYGDKPKVQETLKEHEEDPETFAKPLQKALRTAQVENDEEILEAAQHLMTLIQQQQVGTNNYNIQNSGTVQGQIIDGKNHTITMKFGEPPRK